MIKSNKRRGLTINCDCGIMWQINGYRDVAQLGRVLEWGSRGRKFKSCHPDHVGTSFACSDFFMSKKSVTCFTVPPLSQKVTFKSAIRL